MASHIVPWRNDEENRLNPRNGLCLSMLHDKAFDVGIITIAEDMTVKVSRKQASNADHFFDSALFTYDGKPIALPAKFRPPWGISSLPSTTYFLRHRIGYRTFNLSISIEMAAISRTGGKLYFSTLTM
ncbi:MAG: HNH endonuclease signature motif containing protein [Nitrosomonadales bacterium]